MKNRSKRPVSARQLQAVQTSRHFHVAHQRHTGHIIDKKHTSYPILLMLLLSVGVLLASWTHAVNAASGQDSYVVHASVPGPVPTVAATIDSPKDGDSFDSTPITVSGSCPVGTYVGLVRNDFPSGTAICQADGTYSLQTDLFSGENDLIARVFNYADVPGPDSEAVTVSYTPPTPPPGQGTTTGGSSGTATSSGSTSSTSNPITYEPGSAAVQNLPEPLLLKTNYHFQGFYVGQSAGWQVAIEGGNAPYAIAVDWGDGTSSLYSRPHTATLSLSHIYKKTGGYHGSYVVKVTATDASGNQTFLQIIAVISNPPVTTVTNTQGTPKSSSNGIGGFVLPNSDDFDRLVRYVWPSYGVLVLMFISFWLGERREYAYLRPLLRPRKQRRGH